MHTGIRLGALVGLLAWGIARVYADDCGTTAAEQSAMGVRYAQGLGVLQNYTAAQNCWRKAAAQGDALAQYNLGVVYTSGLGVVKDYVKARAWYEKAAAQGHASAQYNLGVLYYSGLGMRQDYTKARAWRGCTTPKCRRSVVRISRACNRSAIAATVESTKPSGRSS